MTAAKSRRRRAGNMIRSYTHLRLELLEARWLPSTAGVASYGQLPLSFEPNVGQAAAGADFVARGAGYALSLAEGNLSLGLRAASAPRSAGTGAASEVLRLRLSGANSSVPVEATDRLSGVTNYLIGNDPSRWHTNIPTYGRVQYDGVYRGVNLAYYGNQGQLEYDFVVNPGAHPGSIRLQIEGAQAYALDGGGNLLLHTAAGPVVQKAPVAYQQVNGTRRAVAARFVLQDNGTVGFAVGAYDASLALVIDPVLSYSTYLGGSAADVANAIAVDSSGSAYVIGSTSSTDFPTANALQPSHANDFGSTDVFVTKLNPAGTGLVYSTYLGGAGDDHGIAIAVDSSGNAYITGDTYSADFPTAAPFQAANASFLDAFVSKLNPRGNGLVYSSFLGGSGADSGTGIAVDPSGNAYVTGYTASTDFPTANAFQAANAGSQNAFVAKVNSTGTALTYSTYLGGGADDSGQGIAVDSLGSAYVTGLTHSTNFPTANPFQAANAGVQNAFVAKLNPAGTALVYSTYLGGSLYSVGYGIAVDSSGSAYVTGGTSSDNFPTAHPFQAANAFGEDAFVTKLNPAGNGLVYSTYLGGSLSDQGNGIAVDISGSAYVAGLTTSSDFPTANALQPMHAAGVGQGDVFVTTLNPAGNGLIYSTYLGGGGADDGQGIALDSSGNAYVAGFTFSSDFPTANPFRAANAGNEDAFVAKIAGHLWQGRDVTVGSDGKTRLLWNTPDGRADVWSVSNSIAASGGPAYGPVNGWVALETAGGSDGLTRILWQNSGSGAVALWLLAPDGSFVSAGVFGPFAGWTAHDVTVGSDGVTRILWTNTAGQVVVWRVDDSFNVTSSAVFGPYAGWHAVKLDAGPDGLVRLLWTQSNGTTALWLLNANGTYNSATVFGPIQGWQAVDVAVGADDNAWILWTNGAGAGAVWSMNGSFAVVHASVFGPFAGWTPAAITAGPDGLTRLLWNYFDGTTALWLLGADGSFQNAGTFGPY